jgi:hypothetical protein
MTGIEREIEGAALPQAQFFLAFITELNRI